MKRIYVSGRVFAGRLPLQEAFAVEGERFAAVGSDGEVLALRAEGDEVIDLGGRFVCPGFNDSHMHLLNYGAAMSGCDLAAHTASLADVQNALRDFIRREGIAPGQWVKGRGWNQDYFAGEKRIPTRHDLDAVSMEHPICIVRCCGHALVVNTMALTLLGLDGAQPQPEGGQYETESDGHPNGVFCDNAMPMALTRMPLPDRAEIRRMMREACRKLNSVGVTSAQTDDLLAFEGVDWHEVMEAYKEMDAAGELTVRVHEQSQFMTVEGLQNFLAEGYHTGWRQGKLRVGPLKILGDGSLGARTALMSQGYADAPGEKGLAIFTQEQLDALISCAHNAGMQVAVHVIGDGILDRVLAAYEKAFAANPHEDHRSGVVHVQLTRPDQLEKMAQMKLHAYVQSVFLDYDSRIVHARAGEKLASTSYAFRTMREMGMHVSNGTDCPVEKPDPMRGVQCAVTRQPIDGSLPPYNPGEAMTVEEALRSYTAEGAWASFEEREKGCIAPGMLADFVVMSENPFDVEPSRLASIRAVETYLGGEKVYSEG